VAGKLLGAGWGAKLGGLTNIESVQLGAGMISRGEVGLIVASVGLEGGLLGENAFSAVIVMILVTTLITPPILRALFVEHSTKTAVKEKETSKAKNSETF
jgi:Kef-type K+ transport system membrane component KefB